MLSGGYTACCSISQATAIIEVNIQKQSCDEHISTAVLEQLISLQIWCGASQHHNRPAMSSRGSYLLPIFGDVEGPFKGEMSMVIIVDELGDCLVMASSEHSRWCFLYREFLLMRWLVGGVWRIASDHFLVFTDADTFALDDLDVLQAGQNVVLNLEDTFHTVFRTLFDGEGLQFEGLQSTRGGEIKSDIGTTLYFLDLGQE